MLVAVFGLFIGVGFLYVVALNRSISEEALVRNSYFEQVALDLAESGVQVAIARIHAGRTDSADNLSVDLGSVAQFKSATQVSISRTPTGYKIASTGLLKDSNGQERFFQRLVVTGHVEKKHAFMIDSWEEPPH